MRISDWSSTCALPILLAGGAAALVLDGVVGGGILSRSHAEREEAAIATANALPTVSVIHPQSAAAGTFTLPGTVAAYNEAAINARTSGYVAKWYSDIGEDRKSTRLNSSH